MSSTLANNNNNNNNVATATVSFLLCAASPGANHQQANDELICPFTLDIFSKPEADKNCPNCASANGNANANATPPSIAPVVNAQDALPPTVLDTLPTIRHERKRGHPVTQTRSDILAFITEDLDVKRLNDIASSMWMLGRPLNARALHRQQMLGRRIVQTEQADLHLLYHSDIIFVKPLPAYLLCPASWTLHINQAPALHENAAGFLLSYIWLLRSPLDFQLAEKKHLIPANLQWADWKILVSEFLANIDPNSLDQVNKRYHFGELRLGRINTIYRTNPYFILNHFVRGYLYGYNRYVAFFQRKLGWVLVVFVWFSLILSAMQVGVSVPGLMGNRGFDRASYGFVIFSIVMVAALLAFVGVIFIAVFVFNMFAAIGHARSAAKRRTQLAEERKKRKKDA
jgi:hypothetical protein